MNKSIDQVSKEKALEILKLDRKIKELLKLKKQLGKEFKKFLKENEIHFLDNVEFQALEVI